MVRTTTYSDKSPFHILRETETEQGICLFLLSVSTNSKKIDVSLIPAEQQIAISRYRQQHDREKRLLARSFLYHYLNTVYGISRFDTVPGPYKKPLLSAVPYVHFSFSYSGDFILIGVSADVPLGVDIECINSETPVSDMAASIMCREELGHYRQLSPGSAEQYEFFFSVFSAKEAIIKAFGTGLYYDILSLNSMGEKTMRFEERLYTYDRIFKDEKDCCIHLCWRHE